MKGIIGYHNWQNVILGYCSTLLPNRGYNMMEDIYLYFKQVLKPLIWLVACVLISKVVEVLIVLWGVS